MKGTVRGILYLLGAVLLLGFGIYEYMDLRQFQQEGGTRSMNSLLVLVYKVGGPTGVLLFFILAAAGLVFAGIKMIKTGSE